MSDGMTICACGHRRGMHAINGSHCYDVESGNPHTACPCAMFRVPPERPELAALRSLVEAAEALVREFDQAAHLARTTALNTAERLGAEARAAHPGMARLRSAAEAARSALPVDEKEDRR